MSRVHSAVGAASDPHLRREARRSGARSRSGPSSATSREVGADGAGDADARGDGRRHEHADRGVHAGGDERARRDRAAVARRREQEHLRHGRRRSRRRGPSAGPRAAASRSTAAVSSASRLQVGGALVARDAELVRAQQDHRHPVVDQRDAMPVDLVDDVAGRAAAASIRRRHLEVDRARRCRARRRSDGGRRRSRPRRRACGKVGGRDVAGVDQPDAHRWWIASTAGTSPRSTANGPTPGEEVAAGLTRRSRRGWSTPTCRNR